MGILYCMDCAISPYEMIQLSSVMLHKQESENGPVVRDIIKWCDKAFLQVNPAKTKGMMIFEENHPAYHLRPS